MFSFTLKVLIVKYDVHVYMVNHDNAWKIFICGPISSGVGTTKLL